MSKTFNHHTANDAAAAYNVLADRNGLPRLPERINDTIKRGSLKEAEDTVVTLIDAATQLFKAAIAMTQAADALAYVREFEKGSGDAASFIVEDLPRLVKIANDIEGRLP